MKIYLSQELHADFEERLKAALTKWLESESSDTEKLFDIEYRP